MKMQYFWLLNGKAQQLFQFYYKSGQENLGSYPSKHHSADIHQHVCPYCVHMDNSLAFLPQAAKPALSLFAQAREQHNNKRSMLILLEKS